MTTQTPLDSTRGISLAAAPERRSSRWWNGTLVTGLCVLVGVYLIGTIAPLFIDPESAGVGANDVSVGPSLFTGSVAGLAAPQAGHPLGTDPRGRDILASLLVAMPRTLNGALIAALIAVVVGVGLGLLAGYVGGRLDSIISTVADIALAVPALVILVVVAAFLGELEPTVMGLLVALFAWPLATRIVRAQVLTMRQQPWVAMARLSGASTGSIVFREIGPNLLPFVAAVFTSTMSLALLVQTSIEVLGLGARRVPTLGTMMFEAQQAAAIFTGIWWWWLPPVAILAVVFVGLYLAMIGTDRIANPRLGTQE